jgi:ABC-type nitrate/sulfonate/bicarbonate transport system substrate-binding protein
MNPRLYLVAALTLLIFSLAACGSLTGEAAPTNLQEVSVQLTGPHGPEFAGLYMAVANGYYQAEGLSVKLIESGPALDEADSLEQGLVDFSLYQANQAEPITAKDDLGVIAAIFQFSPPVFFSLANSGPEAIVKPQDFAGKRIGVSGPSWREMVAQMMQNVGLDPASATLVDVFPANLEPLYTGQVDVWSGYLNQEVVPGQTGGKKLSLIFPHEYGLE